MSAPQGMFLRKLKSECLFSIIKFVRVFTGALKLELTVPKPWKLMDTTNAWDVLGKGLGRQQEYDPHW